MAFSNEAKWVECKRFDSPKFMKKFNIEENVHTAVLSICGLGFFDLKINGSYVSDDLLVPAWSDYEPRENRRLLYPISDTFTHRVYYLEYDVSKYLKSGENEITVILGNGWYNQRGRTAEGDLWYGDLKLLFDLEINSSIHIVSDESMLVSESNITFNNIFYGEMQDFRIKDNYIETATETKAPAGKLEVQTCPADTLHMIIYPEKIASVGGRDIYDCGENITGWAVFTQPADAGQKTTIRYSEEIDESCGLDFASCGGEKQIQSDSYISDGNKNTCRPLFTYHGFRYFEVEGEYENLSVEVVYADVKITSDFECDSEIINALYKNYIRSQVTNMHCGVPSDCPHRERLGYTGDGQLTCDAAMHMLACREFYRKWIRDIADCQDIKSGHVQHTAPFYGGGGGPGGWGCAIVMAPYFYYKNYFDKDLLKEYYPNMQKWCNYMESRLEDGLVVREEKDGWCLGEWGLKEKILLPEPFVNTYFYIKALMYMQEIAEIISVKDESLQKRIDSLKNALLKNYYDEENNSVLDGVQGAEAFFCDIGLGNEKMLQKINERYDELGGFDTGLFGTDILIRVLFQNGFADTAIKLLSSCKKNASFGYQIQSGATTLWEYWNGEESHNHPMFGSCVKYLFTELMGMKKGEIFRIEPKISKRLSRAKAKITVDGKEIAEEYEIRGSEVIFKISAELSAVFVWDGEEYEIYPGIEETLSFKL
ncbi:MAG: family 78 glycoside hydrolase catalytic domain [Clostridia bacterium]|nr:family 78 glycoside hydrolase catalytic domain [Clostridia bacterium]MBP3359600.1 family 78 glycoside hydrolase catalytic domain [Clostridia bacterium]